ncbi:MAG: hypothetical protein J4N83_06940 [Chloroflexi bacterium]|nr:hypothetical protein [Chloroflexota bacterium]
MGKPGFNISTKSNQIDLRKLAEISAPDRAFLSLYLSGPAGMAALDKRIRTDRALLKDHPDELRYFDRNMKKVDDYFRRNPHKSGSLCLFVCWSLEFFEIHALPVSLPDLLWVDSSPYIRPLAEFQDEYESYAVVVADNRSAKVFLVASSVPGREVQIPGNIKNHVKVGGWSQQRYERRRDKQLQLYAKDIADELMTLDREHAFRRVLMVGSKETLRAIRAALPNQISRKAIEDKALDLGKTDDWVQKEIFDLFVEQERTSEQALWEVIKNELLKSGLAAVGIEDVLHAAKAGRVEKAVVTRNAHFDGSRCRDCEHLESSTSPECPQCGSTSLFKVDLVNECTELLAMSRAEIDFVDPIPSLTEMGDIGALLRY